MSEQPKTDERIVKEREAVDAMRNAKANMAAVLERVDTLERALRDAASAMASFKSYVPAGAYGYPTNGNAKSLHDRMDDAIAAARKPL